MKGVFKLCVIILFILSSPLSALSIEQNLDEALSTLKSLMKQKVVTASKREKELSRAASNVTVVSAKMIEERGYMNLVEILEDVSGFDFATYADGGGEYPSHSFNRGIGGDPGNAKLLIMVNGIVQNNISFNWSQGWTNEQILHDLDRIEIVQGPGSVLYGANALSGIVHLITRSGYEGFYVKPWAGEDNTRGLDLMYGTKWEGAKFQAAIRTYQSDGDGGKDRPDPAGYFHDNIEPDTFDGYTGTGSTLTSDNPNPDAGKPIPDGFNTKKDDKSVRFKLSKKDSELGFFYWDKKDGMASYVPGYEYDATNSNFLVHHSGYHIYSKSDYKIIPGKTSLNSNVWYRVNRQEPDTGFEYFYRFKGMKKSYHSNGAQMGIEEQLDIKLSHSSDLIVGARHQTSRKMEQVVSINDEQDVNSSSTDSSWDEALSGNGLGISKTYNTFQESESALYAMIEGETESLITYSIGGRYERGTDYGETFNPRLGIIFNPADAWSLKLLYGSAFRQPSLFEQHDEFRYNPDLKPEKINTYELENNLSFGDIDSAAFGEASAKVNLFYSELIDTIATVSDPSRAGGERFDNTDRSYIRGLSAGFDFNITRKLSFYLNYIYTDGKIKGGSWQEIEHVAKEKINSGINWLAFDDLLNLNFRLNYVGERKVPSSNGYFSDHAPSYRKANMTLTLNNLKRYRITPQLIVKNVFDEKYYGVGRQSGSSIASDYDPATNINPSGFIPAYHPQPRRTFYINVKMEF